MIEIIESIEDMKPVAEGWNRLAKSHGNPLLDYDWFLAAVHALHSSDSLYIVTYRTEQRLSAIAPLIQSRKNGIRQLEIIGTKRLSEPSGFLYENMEALSAVCEYIVQLKTPTVLQRVLLNSDIVNIFQSTCAGKGKTFTLSAAGAPYVEIKGNWETYFSSLSSRRRYDFRRARKRLSVDHNVQFIMHSPASGEANDLYNQFIAIESANWKGRAGSALSHRPNLREFFKQYSFDSSKKHLARFGFLNIGEDTVAALLGIEYGNRFWVLKIGYDEKWAAASPGIQLMMEALKYSFENGLDQFEFLGSDEPWINVWTAQCHDSSTLVYYPYSITGITMLCLDMLASIVRK